MQPRQAAGVRPGDLVAIKTGIERGAVGVVASVLGQLATVTNASGGRHTVTLESLQIIQRGAAPEMGPTP